MLSYYKLKEYLLTLLSLTWV